MKKKLKKYGKGGSKTKEPIITNDPKDPRLQAYNDSLLNYNNDLSFDKEFAKLVPTFKTLKDKDIQFNLLVKKYPVDIKKGKVTSVTNSKSLAKNKNLGYDFVDNLSFEEPVQPIVYKPRENQFNTNTEQEAKRRGLKLDNSGFALSRQLFNMDGTPQSEIEFIKGYMRPKEQPINLPTQTINHLPVEPLQFEEIQKIPFKKGTYFTRERQSQEAGTSGMLDYFDKKTGKLLGTYEFGGNIITEKYGQGGKISFDEWYKTVNPNFSDTTSYDLRQAYNDLPFNQLENWRKDPNNNHLPDTYKLPNHPTFSDESRYFNFVQPQVLNQAGKWQETDSSWNYIPYNPSIKDTIVEMKKNGGKIHIKEKNKGKFTASAKKAGEGVQEHAHHVMNDPNATPLQKKRANFAIQAKKWRKGVYGLQIDESIDEPTFGAGDEGFMQQNLPFNKNLDFQVDIKNPYEFNPSLTKSLQDYTGNKPQLNQEEQKIYNQYNSNPQNLQGLNQLQNQSIQLPPSTFNITGSKYWAKMNDKLNKAQDQAVKAGEAVVSGFTGGMGGGGKGFMKNGGQLPKAFAGSFLQWGNAAAHSASALGNLGGSMIAGTQALLDTIGTNNINNFVKKTEADRLKQGIYSGAENQPPYENYGYGWQGRNNALMENGGIADYKAYNNGGLANVEIENNETVSLPQGLIDTAYGNTHANGGIKVLLPEGSKVFSDKLKNPDTGKKYSEMAKKFETKKEIDSINTPYSDDISNFTADITIKQKNFLADQLFNEQENNKLIGKHGNKIAKETEENYMKNGGMAKAGNGKSLRGTGKDVENNFKNLDEVYENYKKHGYKGKKDITELREWSYNKNPQEVSAYIERSRPTNAHKKIWEEKYSTTEPVDISKMSPEDRFAGYNDKLWDYRAYKFQDTPQNTAFATETVKTSDKVEPINTKFKGQGFDFGQFKPSSLNLNLPKTYERSPVNVKFVDPNYIDPRYLDINPQLNEINRGVNAIQMNLGDRSANSISNLLQAQANAYNAKNQVFNQKYNYDRGQDSQAQQFNAQAKFNADVTNLGEFNRFQELIGRREGAIQAQKDFDYNAALQNQMEQEKYAQQQELIKQMFNPSASAQGNPFTFNTPKKNGGKIKTKLKPKKSLK